ncbi:MAG: site-specific integrase [Clostridia bacterium]|nr:site-specific integrase [Clostridia bacterium]
MAKKTEKRAPKGDGSVFKSADGRWRSYITVGINPETGKPKRRYFSGQTKEEVRKKKAQALADLEHDTYQEPNRITVKAWLDKWMEVFIKPARTQYTYNSHDSKIRTHILPNIGGLRLQDVRPSNIQQIYNRMKDAGSAEKSIKNVASILHSSFDEARVEGLITKNPCEGAKIPHDAPKTEEIKPLVDAEIPAFLDAIRGEPLENAFALCLIAGLREGECLGLSWGQVDYSAKSIIISQQLQHEKVKGGEYIIVPYTKSKKPRTIILPDIVFDYLRAEEHRQKVNRIAAGSAWCNADNLVFTNKLGQHISISKFYKDFKRIAASIGRPDARPHDLRHTAATVAMANSNGNVKAVQSLLGHSTASFTMNTYAHTTQRMMEDQASRVQSYYDGFKKQG